MAQRSKTKKNQSSGPASLKTEKEAKLTVSQVIRDERTHKITGAVFLLISIFLFIAFTSYLFTWREDQSGRPRDFRFFTISRIIKWPICWVAWGRMFRIFSFIADLALPVILSALFFLL